VKGATTQSTPAPPFLSVAFENQPEEIVISATIERQDIVPTTFDVEDITPCEIDQAIGASCTHNGANIVEQTAEMVVEHFEHIHSGYARHGDSRVNSKGIAEVVQMEMPAEEPCSCTTENGLLSFQRREIEKLIDRLVEKEEVIRLLLEIAFDEAGYPRYLIGKAPREAKGTAGRRGTNLRGRYPM
jgi:hypothetical protein